MVDNEAQQSCQWNAAALRGHGHLFTLGPVLLVLTTRIIYHRYREAIHSHNHSVSRGVGAGPAGTAVAVPMLEAKLMNLIKGQLQKFWLSNNFTVKFTRSRVPAASPDQSWYASDATGEPYRSNKQPRWFSYDV